MKKTIILFLSLITMNANSLDLFDFTTSNSFSEEVDKIKSNSEEELYQGQNTNFTIEPKYIISEITLAEANSALNCSTGAIDVSIKIPDVSSFKDLMKVFAPYAVNSDGKLDFKNFLKEVITEMAIEEVTESFLDLLAYVHYYITGVMSDNTPADFQMMKSDEFKKCMGESMSKSVLADFTGGGSTISVDDIGAKIGMDLTGLLGFKKCYADNKGPIFKSKDERARFEKSKKIVRAMFYKLLNAQFDFNVKMSEKCKELSSEVNGPVLLNEIEKQKRLQLSTSGQLNHLDGSKTIIGIETESKIVVVPDKSKDASISTKTDMSKVKVATTEKQSTKDDGTKKAATVVTGSAATKRLVDFPNKKIYKGDSEKIDLFDFSIPERIDFFIKTRNDFEKQIKEVESYSLRSSILKDSFIHIIDNIIRLQQVNYTHMGNLSCSLNSKRCDYQWITDIEKDIFMNNGGNVNECVKKRTITDSDGYKKEYCEEEKPYRLIENLKKDLKTVSEEDQQKYMTELVKRTMTEYVYSYYRKLSGELYIEDYKPTLTKYDLLEAQISNLKALGIHNKMWSSPFKTLKTKTLEKINRNHERGIDSNSGLVERLNLRPRKTDLIEVLDDIMTETVAESVESDRHILSYTPYIYEPVREMQLAKILHQISEETRILLFLKENATIATLEIDQQSFDKGASLQSAERIIARNHYDSLFSKINLGDEKINPTILNSKKGLKHKLSMDELKEIKRLLIKFKEFYIKRLLDKYTKDFTIVKSMLLDNINSNSTEAALKVYDLDLERTRFKLKQRREMLKLLLY